ncbi:hypothetical protein PFICI_11811 [Pestalotiopsis fici W106-1]|uniref:Uncharacterized protein n=1 Tax=Pestalotiopsis fici (strain W106-1 / CGMCC3.15140) TaxID=1229662 RepID=W3WRF8_PESFW|nr:uncharacterized protein PFICI_11811 [Pestalotiopsis fici W106-1]ETS76424.1 hypothetical protein PFICI_11811 [Pestalotiopsis fici W106-1]
MSSEVSASADEQTSDADEVPNGVEFQDIPSLYNRLHVNFRDVLIALNGNPMAVDSAALEVAHEEFTRLKIWGVQSRASVSGIHGLLDLEEQPEIGNLLIDVLKEANDCLLRILPRAATCDAASLGEVIIHYIY